MTNLLILITLLIILFMEVFSYYKIHNSIKILPAIIQKEDSDYYYYSIKKSFTNTGLILFNAIIDGKKYNFLIDTGANVNLLDSKVYEDVKHLCIPTTDQTEVRFQSNEAQIANSVVLDFVLIDMLYKNTEFCVSDCSSFNAKEVYDIDLHGILGSVFLKQHNWIVNYEKLFVKIPKI